MESGPLPGRLNKPEYIAKDYHSSMKAKPRFCAAPLYGKMFPAMQCNNRKRRSHAMRRTLFALTFLLAAAAIALPARAQEGNEKLDDLLKELKGLVDKAEAQKLADPWFIDDLRGLISRYGETWPAVLLDHPFDSKGSAPDAPWQVRQGKMQMDWSRGLRSRVEIASGQQNDKQVVGQIIGGLLNQALTGQQAPAEDPTTPAIAVARIAVSNAFRMDTDLTARPVERASEGGLEIGVFQADGNAGYRAVLSPTGDQQGGKVELFAVSSRGSTRLIESAAFKGGILDDQPLKLTLSRDPSARMRVALDDVELISVQDNSFRDAFSGILVVNKGGDYALKRMLVKGTQ
jgi:hypothetical protein